MGESPIHLHALEPVRPLVDNRVRLAFHMDGQGEPYADVKPCLAYCGSLVCSHGLDSTRSSLMAFQSWSGTLDFPVLSACASFLNL